MSLLPSGTVSFLFTDVEGSTNLAQAHPGAWEAARQRHHTILRAACEAHKGYIFQVIGDALCVAFGTAPDAIAAAIAGQRALQVEPWGNSPIRVRMGLHSGAAVAHDGDYEGYLTLVQVQRVMSFAHGGQTLISHATAALLAGQLPAGVTLRDMGEHRLKGMLSSEHLWQVITPDLPQDFPPLQSPNAIPNNLPIQVTSFVGREAELAELQRLLTTTRLLTLTGSAGTGKTRLSLQLAAEMLDQYPVGVWFVELAPLTDPAFVPQSVGNVLGIRDEPSRPLVATLLEWLRPKQLMLILDNCKHLVDACARFADAVLHASRETRIIASSREALGIAGELAWRVPSLGTPNPSQSLTIQQLDQYAAIRLFSERAFFAQPSFRVSSANAHAVAQICYRLDGVPLAIELAAVRIKFFSAEQIASRLDDRFRLLTGGSRTSVPRQQTLRGAIDWSYDLLSEQERVLLRRLSVFQGGWTLDAAQAVCAGDGVEANDVLELLSHLLNQSWLMVDEQANWNTETRYGMLETIREYAQEKLAGSAEREWIARQHFAFFLQFAESAESHLKGVDHLVWLKHIALDVDNLRTALRWSLSQAGDSGLRLVGSLFWFWYVRGYWREGRQWAADALARNGSPARPAFRAQALFVLGALAYGLSDSAAAHPALEESLALSRQVGDKWWIAFTLLWMGWQRVDARDLVAARTFLEEALALARVLKNDRLIAEILRALGAVLDRLEPDKARALLEESLALSRKIRDISGLAWVLMQLGVTAVLQGQLEEAVKYLEESATGFRETGNRGGLANALQNLSIIVLAQGDCEKAVRYLSEGLALGMEVGSVQAIGLNLIAAGGVAASRGQAKRAAQLLAAGESVLNARGLSVAVWPVEIAAYNRYVASAHSQLDEATFNTVWAEGSKLTLDEAVTEAEQTLKAELQRDVSSHIAAATNPAGLSEREVEVLRWLAQGLSNQQIADQLVLSRRTVESHVRSIFSKLDVTTRSAATRAALEHKLI